MVTDVDWEFVDDDVELVDVAAVEEEEDKTE